MLTLVHKKKGPWDESDQIFDPLNFLGSLGNSKHIMFCIEGFFSNKIEYLLITILNI